jgi:hypothetical protein
MEVAAVIIGVMLFLWSSAAIATGLSILVTDGLTKRDRVYLAVAVAVFALCIVAYMLLDTDPPPMQTGTTPPIP